MPINLTPLRNKQRIIITGNHGIGKITHLIRLVLDQIGKPYDYMDTAEQSLNGAPILIYKGGSELEGDTALFHQLEPHMMLVHKISDKLPEGYASFDQYLGEFEKLADNLPKAGSMIYNESDDIATIIGKKERADIRIVEYSKLPGQKTNSGYLLTFEDDSFEIITDNENFLSHAAASNALLKRIGVSDKQFYKALKAN